MIKKKYFILLSASLLVLLLGLSSICYADTNNTWTKNQLKNVIYNYQIYCNRTETQANQWLDSFDNNLNTILNTINQYNNVYITFQTGRTFQAFYIGFMNDNSNYWYTYNNTLRSTGNTSKNYYWVFTNGTMDTKMGYGMADTYEFNTDIYYFSKNVYTNSGHGTIKYAAGPKPSTLLTSPYTDDFFAYSYNPDLTDLQVPDIDVSGQLKTIKSMTYNEYNNDYVAIVGMLKFLDYVDAEQYYYDNSISGWKLYRNNDNYIKNNDFESDTPIEVNPPNGWWVGNTLIKFTAWNTFGNNFGPQIFYVYLKDNTSVISNGVLQIGTFSGDYNNNMQNDLNNQLADERTDKVVDKMEELYNKMFTVSGEEIDKIISETFENIQIESGEIAEVGAIMEYLQREPRRFCNFMAET